MIKAKNIKGQVTIFIIVALVVVGFIIIFFALNRFGVVKIPPIFGGEESDLRSQLLKCIQENEKINEVVSLLSLQGGTLNPTNYILYNGTRVDYLCYTNEYLRPCVMQKPLVLQNMEMEIKKSVQSEILSCISLIKRDFESQGYTFSTGNIQLNVSIMPKNIVYKINGPITIKKDESQQRYENFEIKKPSELYQLVMISTSILNYEARYGEADILTYMIYYPSIKVEREKRDEGSTVYKLSGRNTKEVFMFAVRSYAWPAGYRAI